MHGSSSFEPRPDARLTRPVSSVTRFELTESVLIWPASGFQMWTDLLITKDLVPRHCPASQNIGLPSEKVMSLFIVPFSRHAVSLIISPSLRRQSSRQLSKSSPIHRSLSESVRSRKGVSSWLCQSRRRTVILGVAVSLAMTDLLTRNGKKWCREGYSSLRRAQPEACNCGIPCTTN
jgi:hypothetical protein